MGTRKRDYIRPIRKLKYRQLPAGENGEELIEYYEVTIMWISQFISQRYI